MPGRRGQNTPEGWPGRQLSLHGLLVVDTVRGAIRVRKWPRKRGRKRNPTNMWWSEWLRQAMALWRYSPPRWQETWRQATRDLPVKVTDPYIQAVRGTIWYFQNPDGSIAYPRQMRDKVSYSLDAIIQKYGGMLARGKDNWVGIEPPTSEHQVLSPGGDLLPHWTDRESAGLTPIMYGATSGTAWDDTISPHSELIIPWATVGQYPDDVGIWTTAHRTRWYAYTQGWYQLSSYVHLSAWTGGTAILRAYSSFSSQPVAGQHVTWTGSHGVYISIASTVWLDEGDYLYVGVSSDSDSTETVADCQCSFTRVA